MLSKEAQVKYYMQSILALFCDIEDATEKLAHEHMPGIDKLAFDAADRLDIACLKQVHASLSREVYRLNATKMQA